MSTKATTRSSSVVESLPIVPPAIAPLTEPVIDWTKLSSPVESTTQKACRSFGQFLIILSIFSGVGRYFAATHLTASPDTIINTCYTLRVVMIVSAVTGVVLWFFNRLTEDPQALLEERGKVKGQIGTACLADLRQAHNQFVVSNHELNQWVRYLVQKSPFNEFIAAQSERVFDLELEEETKDLLKVSYLVYVRATDMSFKQLTGQRAFQVLLSKEEQDHHKKLVANREAAKLKIFNAATYKLFIGENGIEVLTFLEPSHRENLAPAFRDHVLQSDIGILQLKMDRAAELHAFGEQPALFLDLANGEGNQPYETFKARNGVEAIGLITNPTVKEALWQSFFTHVVSRGLGLVDTRATFGDEIVRFGEGAPQAIYTQVLQNETNALGRGDRTYLQFRQRNGVDVIEFNAYGNFDLAHFFKECFLRLPATDLVNPAFEIDRRLLGISPADVRSVLEGRWMGMTFVDIFALDREGFIASVSGENRCFDPRGWTPKAVQETSMLSIQNVIATYRVLFTAGVLTAADGNFTGRLRAEIQPIVEWTVIVDRYGTSVFESRLLDPSQVRNLVYLFVQTHAESFLEGRFETGIAKYADVIQRFCMDPVLFGKIAEAKGVIAAENKRYDSCLESQDRAYALSVEGLNDETKDTIASLESTYNLPQKEIAKNKAHQQWIEKKAAYEALAQRKKADDVEIEQAQKTIEEKSAQLGELAPNLRTDLDISRTLAQANSRAQQAQTALKSAEDFVSRSCSALEAELTALQREENELREKIQNIEALQREHGQLTAKIQGSAERKAQFEKKIKNADQPVTGLEAAIKAKKEVAEAPALLNAMKADELRLAELEKLLNGHQPESHRAKLALAVVSPQVAKKQAEVLQFRSRAERDMGLSKLRQEASQASQTASHWKAKAVELQKIEQLSFELKRLRSDFDRKVGARDEKERQLASSLQQVEIAKSTKEAEELSYNTFAQQLAEKTTEARQRCSREKEGLLSEKNRLRGQADSTHTQNLDKIVRTFRQQLIGS